jgi:hypothetical protein
VIKQCPPPLRKEVVLPLGDLRGHLAAAGARARNTRMPGGVAIPPACLVSLSDGDDEEWPAMFLEASSDDRFTVAEPRRMDERTPAPAAVASFAMDDLPAAGAELSVIRKRPRPDPGDDLFRPPKCGPLLI